LRLQLRQQGQQWARRHIADTGEVGRLFLRTGTLFVALTILSASSLTLVAMAPQQEVDVGALEDPLEDVADELARLLAFVAVPTMPDPQVRPGERFEVQDVWRFDDGLAFTASLDGKLMGNYWWGWAADRFDGRAWTREIVGETDVDAGRLISVPPPASAAGPHPLQATITVEDASFALGTVFAPAEPIQVSEPVLVSTIDDRKGLGDITFDETLEPGDAYIAETFVRDYRRDGSSLTASELEKAGSDYPPWVIARYLDGAGGEASGSLARAMAERIEIQADNAYDRALSVQNELSGGEFVYDDDISDLPCEGLSIPQCLLTHKRGFCQHYASTMVMVLREMDIPARYVTGYLPGEIKDGVWQVKLEAFHTWVEAYFPDYGWVRFDPTPGLAELGQRPTAFAEGEQRPPSGPETSPEPTLPLETGDPLTEPTFAVDQDVAPVPPSDEDPLGTLLIAGLLAAMTLTVVFGLLFLRLRRLSAAEGGVAYRGIVSLATRLGHGPHPAQTEYEYAGTLSETIPTVRDDLYLVADARVETAYGQRRLDKQRQSALRRAYARIRTALIRLSLRLRR
jgi:transglutaminase-like putative cysteine protease